MKIQIPFANTIMSHVFHSHTNADAYRFLNISDIVPLMFFGLSAHSHAVLLIE